jgi:cytochrome c
MRKQILLISLALLVLGSIGLLILRDQWPGGGQQVWTVPGGDPQQGRQAILKYGCSACHVIDGIRQATGRVGPKLEDFGQQIYIGGVLPNTPDNLIQWIMNPNEVSPDTAMPDLDVTEQDARDIAAYLYEQR